LGIEHEKEIKQILWICPEYPRTGCIAWL
jgi:hypothetical protein